MPKALDNATLRGSDKYLNNTNLLDCQLCRRTVERMSAKVQSSACPHHCITWICFLSTDNRSAPPFAPTLNMSSKTRPANDTTLNVPHSQVHGDISSMAVGPESPRDTSLGSSLHGIFSVDPSPPLFDILSCLSESCNLTSISTRPIAEMSKGPNEAVHSQQTKEIWECKKYASTLGMPYLSHYFCHQV
jgi:hypothetical protein